MATQSTVNPIRILLADDHTLFRRGIRQMLQTDPFIEVVGEAANGEEAIALARKRRPHVIFLDINMPLMGGQEAIEQLLKVPSSPRILILSMYTDEGLIRYFLAQGASGYLSKSASINELVAAVRNAVECPRSPKGENAIVVVPRKVFERIEKEEIPITPRQLEVLLLAARGLSNRQIANSLALSEATVKRHLANVYSRLGVSSRGEAVKKALSEQWLTVQDIG